MKFPIHARKTSIVFASLLLVLPSVCTASEKVTSAFSHLAAPTDLKCAGKAEPLAVADARPVLSWKVQATEPSLRGVAQSAYEVRIGGGLSELLAGKAILWDSGKVQANATSLTSGSTASPAFESQKQYFWQVRVWDEQGNVSGWSQAARWTQAPAWHAQWIAADKTDEEAGAKPMPLFRKDVEVGGTVARAVLHVSGLGQYEFHINGIKVGQAELAPGWSDYRKTVFYDSYDVTSLVKTGTNALGAMLGNGMYRVLETKGRYTKFIGSYGPPKCVVQLHVEMADGKSFDVVSDGSWKTRSGPITFSSTYGGEDDDARSELDGWDRVGADESGWSAALVTEGPGGAMTPEMAPPIRVRKTYSPIRQTEPKPGVLVYDLGQNFAGWPAITLTAAAGTTVKLIAGELLNADGTVSQESSGAPQWYSYTAKGKGTEEWHPRFSYYGFRYVQVEGAATPSRPAGGARLISLRGQAVHTSSQAVGSFDSSDELLNRIHRLIVRAIENNAESLFTDCPHREKLGWLEETHLLASSFLYDFDFGGIYAATARNIADSQKLDEPNKGRVAEIAPQYVLFQPQWGIFDDSPEWGSAAVLAPWYVYERDGDLQALISHVNVMRLYVDYLTTRAKDGIIAYGLGDWYDIGPGEPGVSKLTTPGVTATAIYYQDLRVLEKTLALAGNAEESRKYGEMAESTRRVFNARFFDGTKRRYDKGSQTAQAMPLALGMVEEPDRAAVLDALINDIRSRNNHVTAGDIGYHYVVVALLESGRSDVLYDMLERTDSPSYGYQLAQGATALTEAWDADPKSSQDHFMLGHVEEWFYRGLGGINMNFSAPARQQLVLRPELVGKLAWVHSSYWSAWGEVESNWQRGPEQTTYEFVIPANATATVELKTAAPDQVNIDGMGVAKTPGVLDSKVTPRGVSIVLGSGHYRVIAANPVETLH